MNRNITCNSDLEYWGWIQENEKVSDVLICETINCSENLIRDVLNWFDIFNIKEINESMIKKLYNNNIFKTFTQFIYLSTGVKDKDILKIGFKEENLDLLKKSINKIKNPTMIQFLVGLNLNGVKEIYYQNILENIMKNGYKNSYSIYEVLNYITKNNLNNIMGNKLDENIKNEISIRRDYIKELFETMNIKNLSISKLNKKLVGKEFCVTGTLSKGKRYFEKLIKENGGVSKKSISKSLDYLVVGNNIGGKLSKAKDFGVKIIDENEFYKLINGGLI